MRFVIFSWHMILEWFIRVGVVVPFMILLNTRMLGFMWR
jgi:hypothetical protein